MQLLTSVALLGYETLSMLELCWVTHWWGTYNTDPIQLMVSISWC